MNMSWEPDTVNLFTLSAYWANNGWGSDIHENRSMLAPDLSQIWRLTRDTHNTGLYNSAGPRPPTSTRSDARTTLL